MASACRASSMRVVIGDSSADGRWPELGCSESLAFNVYNRGRGSRGGAWRDEDHELTIAPHADVAMLPRARSSRDNAWNPLDVRRRPADRAAPVALLHSEGTVVLDAAGGTDVEPGRAWRDVVLQADNSITAPTTARQPCTHILAASVRFQIWVIAMMWIAWFTFRLPSMFTNARGCPRCVCRVERASANGQLWRGLSERAGWSVRVGDRVVLPRVGT
jgi:hypothetical protein